MFNVNHVKNLLKEGEIMYSPAPDPQSRDILNFPSYNQHPPVDDAMEQDSEDDSNLVVIPIDQSFSDGDPAQWPTEERFQRPDDTFYRLKLADMWLKETGAYENGLVYILDNLPAGYAVFDRPRGTNPSIRDRFLYGHPVGQYFSSIKVFFPHFYYLMTGGTTKCPCELCKKLEKRQREPVMGARRGRPPGPSRPIGRPPGTPIESPMGTPVAGSSGRPRRGRPPGRSVGRPSFARPSGRSVGRPPGRLEFAVVDSEGTPDVFKLAIAKLKHMGNINQEVTEASSMDWRAERSALEEYLEVLDMRPSYIPRLGELVLWTPVFYGDLAWNSKTQSIHIYSSVKNKWLKRPEWRAGVIGQTPTDDIVLQDLVETTKKNWDLNYSGFRVETLPDPNSPNKSYSLHSKYVPLKCIKPFNAFELFLQGIPRENLHPSIENAMTVMSSFSLLDKYRIRGAWPNASICCRGIFIGAELFALGDAIRLKPKGYRSGSNEKPPPVTDVMVISEIRLELIQCDEDVKSKQLAEQYHVRISGKIYTPDIERAQMANNGRPAEALLPHEVVDVFHNVGMSGYGEWYKLFSEAIVDISQDMALGRCYEPDAMKLLFNSLSLGYDLQGVVSGREYSRNADERIPEGNHWFWGDFRTQTLAIDSLNDEDVGHYSETRDVKMWRANLRILDGTATKADLQNAKHPGELGRPSVKPRISSLAEVGKTSKLVSAGLGPLDTSNPVSSVEEDSESASEGVKGPGGEEEIEGDIKGSEVDETSDELEETFETRIEELRGGTEETEGGDYSPSSVPSFKRPKHDDELEEEIRTQNTLWNIPNR
ncbi:transcription-silencing protein Clr2-domain-containing protein [Aspergillus heterothallicus]